ncbi:MAG TPA: ribosome-associated translation inhibitor RaiA [Patescibacteria group bacterium]|nr:ribosome-associated translation inhibitor RaiA [Patescibacteria group bacterium]
MQVTIQGKQIDLGNALRVHVQEKMEDVNSKFFNRATFATVTFSREGHGHGLVKTHITLQVGKNIKVLADATEGDAYLSFDRASDKIADQLRRYKKRLRDHHERIEKLPDGEALSAREHVLADGHDEIPHGDDPPIIAEMTMEIETLSVSEAVMRMDLAGLPALMFRNASHDGLNMIYRRADGNVGWVDPVGNHVIAKTTHKTSHREKSKAGRA